MQVPDINRTFNSKVSFVGSAIDVTSRGFIVEAKLPADANLKPNQVALVKIHTIGRHAVRRAVQHHGIFLGLVFRQIDRGEQLDPVAHGDHVLVLGIVLLDIFHALSEQGGNNENKENETSHGRTSYPQIGLASA